LRKEIERYDHKIKNGEDFLLKFPEQSTYEALFLEIGLDDFSKVYIDSTHVEGSTSYPTDVSILYKLTDAKNVKNPLNFYRFLIKIENIIRRP